MGADEQAQWSGEYGSRNVEHVEASDTGGYSMESRKKYVDRTKE